MDERPVDFPAAVRVLQIINGALVLGVVAFVGVALFQHGGRVDVPKSFGPVTIAALVFALGALILHRVLFRMFRLQFIAMVAKSDEPLDRTSPPMDLYGALQTRTIIALALLEGAAFFNVTAYFTEANAAALAAALVLIVAMMCYFPTPGRVGAALESDRRRIEEDRSLR